MDVIAYSHTHWDREWYHSFEEFRLRFIEVFDDIIAKLQSNELSVFYLDAQTILIDDYLEIFPSKKDLIENLIKNKKLYVGPWYVLSDELLPSGESLIRSLLIGIRQAKTLGCCDFAGYLPDSFGHNSAMPAILNGFDIKNAIFWRGGGDRKSEFLWKSKDGTEVLATYLIQGYFQDAFSLDVTEEKRAEILKLTLDKIKEYNSTNTILLPVGADHLKAVDNLKNKIAEINKRLDGYHIKEGSVFDYLSAIKPKHLETYTGELRDNKRNYILPGVYSTRTYIKQQHAEATHTLTKLCEPLQTLCNIFDISPSRKAQLDYGWKLFLQNNPHDSICGCSIDEVHREMMTRYEKLKELNYGIIARVKKDLIKKFPKANLIICNPSAYQHRGTVEFISNKKLPSSKKYSLLTTSRAFPFKKLHDPKEIPITEDMTELYTYTGVVELKPFEIKAISYDMLKEDFEEVKTTKKSLENEYLKVELANGKIILQDKRTNKTFNINHSIKDFSDYGDTYNYAPIKNDTGIDPKFLSSSIIKNTPHQGIIELTYEIGIPDSLTKKLTRSKRLIKHLIKTQLILKTNSKFLEFLTEFDNKSKDHMLTVSFHMKENITSTISEDAEGLLKREFNPNFDIHREIKNIPPRMELKTNTAPMQRFVCTQNIGIITQGLQEYSVEKNKLNITLLRSTALLSNPKNPARKVPAGPPLEVKEAQCTGKVSAKYAIYPYEDENELFEQTDKFFGNIISFDTEGDDSQKGYEDSLYLLETDNKNIYFQSLKQSEDSEHAIILRCLNLSSKKQQLKIKSDIKKFDMEITNLEEIIKEKNISSVEFKPYELKTVKLISKE